MGNPRKHNDLTAGIDIGGTKIRWTIVRAGKKTANVIAAHEVPTPKDHRALEALLDEVFLSLARRDVRSAGISAAGHIDAKRRAVISAHNTPALRNIFLRKLATAGVNVRIDNDARCFALAEARYGRARRASPILAITLGTGIGRAVVKNGALLPDKHLEFAEPWERGYRRITESPAEKIAAYLAPHLAALAVRHGARAVVLGGGRLRTPELFNTLKRELRRTGFRGTVARSRYRENSAAIGAALLVQG